MQKIQTFAHENEENGNSLLESALTTTYFKKCSRGMAFLQVNRRPLFQKWNTRFSDTRTEWLFWNNPEYILIPE